MAKQLKGIDLERGMQVTYLPPHSGRDPEHKDSEDGFISSLQAKGNYVWVRYWHKGTNELRTTANSEMTSLQNLILRNTRPPEIVAQALLDYCSEPLIERDPNVSVVGSRQPGGKILQTYVETGEWRPPQMATPPEMNEISLADALADMADAGMTVIAYEEKEDYHLEAPAANVKAWPEPTVAQPSMDELEEVLFGDENATATDGCENLEPDGQCVHGYPSWPRYLGLV